MEKNKKIEIGIIFKGASKAAMAAAAVTVPLCLVAGDVGTAWACSLAGCAGVFLLDAGYRLAKTLGTQEAGAGGAVEEANVKDISMEEPSLDSNDGKLARHLRLVVSNP
jgi:hypothetical protein